MEEGMATKKSTQYRQGHILLQSRKSLPASAQPVEHEPGKVVIARGETGREHLFKSERVALFQGQNEAGVGSLFIEVIGDEPVELLHEEHGVIELDPGVWEVIEQREQIDEGQPRRSFPD
jgi:hypothetical protein